MRISCRSFIAVAETEQGGGGDSARRWWRLSKIVVETEQSKRHGRYQL